MEFYSKTAVKIPPLVIMRDANYFTCGSGYDAHLWLKPKAIRRSNGFVISDPDGSLSERYGKTFRRAGFSVKVLNTADLTKSVKYNPLMYINGDGGIPKFVTALLNGTKGGGKPGDSNFLAAESLLLTALLSYMRVEAQDFERNFRTLTEMLKSMEDAEENGYEKNAVDFLFEDKAEAEPEHFSVKHYNNFKAAADKNKGSIIKSCADRIAPLDAEEMREFFSSDELNLKGLNFPLTALFVIAGNASGILNFVAPLMYSQLFDVLGESCSI